MIKLPPELDRSGTAGATTARCATTPRGVPALHGRYDGNPSSLDNLPPESAAPKFVEYMGGEAAVIAKAASTSTRASTVDRRGVEARRLRQPEERGREEPARGRLRNSSAYQAESGPWRSCTCKGVRVAQRRAERGRINTPARTRSRPWRPRCCSTTWPSA